MKLFILDVGTSSMRGTLLDAGGQTLWAGQVKYRPTYREDGTVEEDPADWLNAMCSLCQEAAAHGPDAVGITSQRSSLIPVDEKGAPQRPAIMWQDTRNRAVCHRLTAEEKTIRALSGTGVNTVYSGGKMAWFRENEPARYRQTEKLFVPPDYLIYHMTGERVTDHTYGSRSMLMDLRQRAWSPKLLNLFGVEREKLCQLIPPSSVAGHVTEAFAARTGLKPGIPVVTCGGDQQCGALGQGAFAPGTVSVNLGTGAYLIAATPTVPEELDRGLICNASAIPGEYILESSLLTCGSAVDWFLRELCPGESVALVGEALRVSPPGAGGVIALPYFQGRAAPDWNSAARAAFLGLGVGSGRMDLLRALLESICIEVSRALAQLESLQPLDALCLSGGLSQTPELCQLLADVMGKPVTVSPGGDATTRGGWMSAARCLGLAEGWDDAWARIRPRDSAAYAPDTALTALYQTIAKQLENAYGAICGPETKESATCWSN